MGLSVVTAGCVGVSVVTVGCVAVSVGGGGGAHLPGAAEAPAVEEDGQVDDVPHVVVAVDVGVSQHAVQVLVDGLDDDVGVAGKDGDEGALGEEDPHLSVCVCVCVGVCVAVWPCGRVAVCVDVCVWRGKTQT